MSEGAPDPSILRPLVAEAMAILRDLDFPREQLNERSAMTLLTLLRLDPRVAGEEVRDRHSPEPSSVWRHAEAPLLGITEIMEYIRDHLGKKYAPNTRETIRRQTIHQFVQAGLVVQNPDDPTRPTNSPHNRYQVTPMALKLLRTFGSPGWSTSLTQYHATVAGLRKRYAAEREMRRIPLLLPSGAAVTLSPGGQSDLVKLIITEFCPRFTPGGKLLYLGDTGKKWAHFDEELARALCVSVDEHGKMPDVAVYYQEKNWLVLIEAVTSHGPMNPKRVLELKALFAVLEIIGGILAYFLSQQFLVNLATIVTADELGEDPRDFFANYLLHSAQTISISSEHFAAFYLFSHGIIKLWVIVGLLRKKLWYYPVAMVIFGFFILYQVYRFSFTHSIWLLLITLLDIIVIWLTWHEYNYLRHRL